MKEDKDVLLEDFMVDFWGWLLTDVYYKPQGDDEFVFRCATKELVNKLKENGKLEKLDKLFERDPALRCFFDEERA